MESALRMILESTFGEFVENLNNIDASSFPLTLKGLKLKEKRIQEELDEDGGFPFDITAGRIGSVTVSPGWLGDVEVVANNIVLNFSFNAMKAMRKAMKTDQDGAEEEEQMHAPPPAGIYAQRGAPMQPAMQLAPVPPRYCSKHSTSEQRTKVEPRMVECTKCHLKVQTNYLEFALCPQCSDHDQRCMLCGGSAPNAGNYVPSGGLAGVPAIPGGGPGPCPGPGQWGGGPGEVDRPGSPSRLGQPRQFGYDDLDGLPPPPPPPPVRARGSTGRSGVGTQAPPPPNSFSRQANPLGTSIRETNSPSRQRGQFETQLDRPFPGSQGSPSSIPLAGPMAMDRGFGRQPESSKPDSPGLMNMLNGMTPFNFEIPKIADLSAWATCMNPAASPQEIQEAGGSTRYARSQGIMASGSPGRGVYR